MESICYNFIMVLIDFLYSIVLILTIPFWIRYLFRRRYRFLLKRRFFPDLPVQMKKSIWIHAVSVGEVRSMKSLISELTRRGKQVILSVTTPSGYECARQEFSNIPVIPAPFDFSFVVRRFIRILNPELIVFNELELWPNWIYTTSSLSIPMILINGRISDTAFKKYILFSRLVGRFLSRLDCVIAQSECYRSRFEQLKIPGGRIFVCGNIKADEARERALRLPPSEEVAKRIGISLVGKPILVVASSHEGDENVVFPVLPDLIQRFSVIIAPRHPERVPEITTRLNEVGVAWKLFSSTGCDSKNSSLLIIDRIGFLMEIMQLARFIWMGGTCSRRIGGHNLYEAAVLGKVVLGGTHYENFIDIGRDLEKAGVYHRVANTKDFLSVLNSLENADFDSIGEKAREEIRAREGSMECILEHILRARSC